MPFVFRQTIEKGASQEWEALVALADKVAPNLRTAYLETIARVKKKVSPAKVQQLLEQGRVDDILQLAFTDPLVFDPMRVKIQSSIAAMAEALIKRTRFVARLGGFDQINPYAVDAVQSYGARLIRQMTEDLKQTIRDIVSDGIAAGINPRETARAVRGQIGLTTTQRKAVQNFRRLLEDRSAESLTRELRDRRFDPSVRAHILGDKTLSAADISRMVERYEERYLKYRAEAIARTESIRGLSIANRAAWKQAEQKIGGETVRRWYTARDERLCEICAPIPRMNEGGVGLDEPFDTPEGPVMDPPMHPHCRCVTLSRIA